jgi:4-amino-4-deoxy-L-arabinose transferase-like glycosyltransferase
MHLPHLNKELMSNHAWRQTQTQSTINSFYEEDMNIFNPRRNERGNGDGLFRMEFPLMQWLVAAAYKVAGKHLLITRLFMLITGFLSVWGIFRLLRSLFGNETMALMGAWAFNFSPAFYYYTINPLPDNLALCCSIWGLAFFFDGHQSRKLLHLCAGGLLLSIGALCKLPFILYFIVPFWVFLLRWKKNGLNKPLFRDAFAVLSFAILPLAWYLSVMAGWKGNGIVQGVLGKNTDFSLIGEYLRYHLITTLPESLINYAAVPFFAAAFYFIGRNKTYRHFLFPVFIVWSIAILAYFFFEINMIEKVHDYYLFPFYPILFILVAYGAYQLYLQGRISRYIVLLLLLLMPVTAFLRMKDRWNPSSPGFNADLLQYKTSLRDAVPPNALCIVGNDISHFIFLYYVDKKGWVFDSNNFTPSQLQHWISQGAEYLYCDSREIDEKKEMQLYLGEKVMEKGSIRVYRLKK